MAYVWWDWYGADGKAPQFRELTVDIKIHNDIGNFSDKHGMYLMLGSSSISGVDFYYGLQTSIYDPRTGQGAGKGLIFSRWSTRDLANARVAPGGWTQSSGHEGDFIGVRYRYEWTEGEYRLRLASDGADEEGEWFGIWVTDLSTGAETWAGSLRFPSKNGKAVIHGSTYATAEIYGDLIRPIDLPEWHVSLGRPRGDGAPAYSGTTGYAPFTNHFSNAEVHYDRRNDVMDFRTGGATERKTPPQTVIFE